ncbi:hypothetical protein [Streptomyces sp. ICBB 8177]|uniref:hypothetical protein n=1 Tax=Streptomyces sp. ICBB 8177 TaxID=563922 RepID=UPI000D67463A|nr:hypothetical protein [Streptomyces sp. ICBB 8177]PWI45787.1 hypothetical protein CK485_01035 [Streptomyces sp. ICBB 8177]
MTTPETTPEWPDPGPDRHQPQYDARYDGQYDPRQQQPPYADDSWQQQPEPGAQWQQQPQQQAGAQWQQQAGGQWQQPPQQADLQWQPQAGYDAVGYDAHQAYGAAPASGYGQAPAHHDRAGGHGVHDPSYGTAPRPAGAQPLPGPVPEAEPVSVPAPEPQAVAPQAPSRRTGSPIIPPGIQPALLTAALAALTAGAAGLARPALAVAAVLLQAVTAAGWFRLNGMWPARQGIMLAFLAGVTADVALLLAPADRAPAAILGTLGVWVLLILVQQMRHRGSADERLAGLTATAASTLLTVLAAGWVALDGTKGGAHAVIVGAVAVGAATPVRAVRLPGPVSVVAALLVGGGAGAFAGHLLHMPASAALTALAAAVCALVGLRVASYDWPSRFVHFTAGVALPLALAAPVVYAVGHVLA